MKLLMAAGLMIATVVAPLPLSYSQSQSQSFPIKRYIVAQLALEGADAYFTQQAQCRSSWVHCGNNTGSELNPIARELVGSRKGVVMYFAGESAVKVVSVWLMERRGHRRVAKWLAITNIGGSVAGVGSGIRVYMRDGR